MDLIESQIGQQIKQNNNYVLLHLLDYMLIYIDNRLIHGTQWNLISKAEGCRKLYYVSYPNNYHIPIENAIANGRNVENYQNICNNLLPSILYLNVVITFKGILHSTFLKQLAFLSLC